MRCAAPVLVASVRASVRASLRASVALVAAAGCGAATVAPAPPVERAPQPVLGMNDVSMLLPLPRELGAPVVATLGTGGPDGDLIERRWYDALVGARGDIAPRTGASIAFDD